MERTPGNWTCIALAALLASAPPMSFAEPAAPGDARHCLDLGSNQAIIQCAEPYRPGGSRSAGKARRDTAPAAAAPAAPAPAPQRAASTPKASPDPAPPPAPRRKSRKREADARHCLDLESMAAIARCAEKYR